MLQGQPSSNCCSVPSNWSLLLFVISLYQDGGHVRSILFLVLHCWYRCLQKIKVYEQTKFRRHISIDGWDITTNVFGKQRPPYWFWFRPFARNVHVILHQATEFRPNWSIHCGNTTSYPFLKMAAATAEYHFRFRICWCHCLQGLETWRPVQTVVTTVPRGSCITSLSVKMRQPAVRMRWQIANISVTSSQTPAVRNGTVYSKRTL